MNKNKKPSLSDFGQNLQQVVERAVNSFDANSLALLQKLCILGRWTDEIFRAVIPDYEAEFYFGVWSDIILRTTDKPAELMTLYEEKFDTLEERFDNSTRATTVQKFLDKVSDAEPLEPLPHAYFQNRLGRIRRSQYRIKEALELNEAAYSKVKDLPLSKSERLFKLYIMSGYANVLEELKRYTDEIKLCEKMVDECERYLPDDIDLIIEVN